MIFRSILTTVVLQSTLWHLQALNIFAPLSTLRVASPSVLLYYRESSLTNARSVLLYYITCLTLCWLVPVLPPCPLTQCHRLEPTWAAFGKKGVLGSSSIVAQLWAGGLACGLNTKIMHSLVIEENNFSWQFSFLDVRLPLCNIEL